MTIYYGVWSGEEWYALGQGVFHTTVVGLAKAQAMVVSRWFTGAPWEARAIGEDGLPVPPLTEEQKEIRAEVASHCCDWCGDPATGWVEMAGGKWYHCDPCEATAREAAHSREKGG